MSLLLAITWHLKCFPIYTFDSYGAFTFSGIEEGFVPKTIPE
ncbi:hypothetical protein ADIS_0478 [Lunatimonas lonarensis]|uniref:Uncharacterized protein n=1 Tax=Lunatimonas lonarensis TaxID=1232681 RepID=R7ZY35_9BACT|nr:hypothetical protein ADIS_0478 [Lunatimonas lonarensis]